MTELFHTAELGTEQFNRRDFLKIGGIGLGSMFMTACGESTDFMLRGETPSATTQLTEIINGADANVYPQRGSEQIQVVPTLPPPILWRPGDLILAGDRNGPKIVTGTSDDGPTGQNGILLANHLRDAGLEGLWTFFMVANNLAIWSNEGRQVYERGYTIGNHSKTHGTYTASGIAKEIEPAQQIFDSVLGFRPVYFRAPGLTEGSSIQLELARLGMVNIATTTNLNDWVSPRISSQQIINNLARTIHPGNIILLHDGGTHMNTINAMPGIIDTVHRLGYEFVSLDEMLASGILQTKYRVYADTVSQILDSVSKDEQIQEADKNTIIDLMAYMEMTSRLEPERRAMIEKAILEIKNSGSNIRS